MIKLNKALVWVIIFATAINLPSLFWGISFSGPLFTNSRYGDEGVISGTSISMFTNFGDPGLYAWPHLYLFLGYAISLLPRLIFFNVNPALISYLFLRSTSLIFFLWTLSIIYKIGASFPAPFFSKKQQHQLGIISAFIASILPINLNYASLQVTEPVLLFFSTLAIYSLQKALIETDESYYIKAWIYTALATSVKFNAIILFMLVFIAMLFWRKRFQHPMRLLLKGISYSIIVFIFTFFYFFVNWEAAIQSFVGNFSLVQSGGGGSNHASLGLGPRLTGFNYNLIDLVNNFGIIGLFLFVASAVLLFFNMIRRNTRDKEFNGLAFLYLTFIFISIAVPLFFIANIGARYFFQIFSLVPIVIGIILTYLLGKVKDISIVPGKPKVYKRVALTALVFLCIIIANNGIAIPLSRMKDGITIARDWISNNLSAKDNYGLDSYTEVPYSFKNFSFIRAENFNPSAISTFNYSYLLISGSQYDRWVLLYPDLDANQTRFYQSLFNGSTKYTLIKQFVHTNPGIFSITQLERKPLLGLDITFEIIFNPNSLLGGDVYIFKNTEYV